MATPHVFSFLSILLASTAFAHQTPHTIPAAAPQPVKPVAHSAQQARFGLHGMLLFTDGVQLFASHLPMFHATHDVQVVLKVSLADEVMQRRLVDMLWQAPSRYWTLEPELFDLNRLAPAAQQPLRQFQATLYQGHFERGGAKQAKTGIQVEQVLWYYPLQFATASQSSSHTESSPATQQNGDTVAVPISQFQLLSQQAQSCVYLYRIGKQPSFDQILIAKRTSPDHMLICPAVIEVPAAAELTLSAVQTQLHAQVTSIYLETGDLQ